MSYREAKEFLDQHTGVVELSDGGGARVAVCPGWQGRVMTSTCGGAGRGGPRGARRGAGRGAPRDVGRVTRGGQAGRGAI